MKDIELLEKYARERRKTVWDIYAKDTDIQRLRREETACWFLLVYFGISARFFSKDVFSDHRLFTKLLPLGIFTFCVFLCLRLAKVQKLRSLFERTAVQNAGDLIESMKKSQNQAAEAHQPKLITKGKFISIISGVCVGSGLCLVLVYFLVKKHVTATCCSAIAFGMGMTILFFIIRYVNKPEK